MKGAGGDEENVVRSYRTELARYRRSFDDREEISLHAFSADVGTRAATLAGHLIEFVEEDDAGLLRAKNGFTVQAVGIDEFSRFLIDQEGFSVANFHSPCARFCRERAAEVGHIEAHLFEPLRREDLHERVRGFFDIDLYLEIVVLALFDLLGDLSPALLTRLGLRFEPLVVIVEGVEEVLLLVILDCAEDFLCLSFKGIFLGFGTPFLLRARLRAG